MGGERRQHLRVVVPGAWADIFVAGASIAAAEIRDVSDNGLFLAYANPTIPEGTRVVIKLLDEDLSLEGLIVSRMMGDPRTAGFGVQLIDAPQDTVERVAKVPTRPAPPPPQKAAPAAKPVKTPSTAGDIALILLEDTLLAESMSGALSSFGVSSVAVSTPDEAAQHMRKRAETLRVGLVDLASFRGTKCSLSTLHTAAPRCRLFVFSAALPDAETRTALLRQGAHQLFLPPLAPFEILAKFHGICRG